MVKGDQSKLVCMRHRQHFIINPRLGYKVVPRNFTDPRGGGLRSKGMATKIIQPPHSTLIRCGDPMAKA